MYRAVLYLAIVTLYAGFVLVARVARRRAAAREHRPPRKQEVLV